MTKQGEAWASDSPPPRPHLRAGQQTPRRRVRLPPGRAGALWPAAARGAAWSGRGAGGGRGQREAGRSRHFRWPLARRQLQEATAGAEGARGPGLRIPRPPSAPRGADHGCQVGG